MVRMNNVDLIKLSADFSERAYGKRTDSLPSGWELLKTIDNPGQDAEVKVETFPFTKYGTIHGKIMQVSSDAIQDEKLGLIYSTRVKLARDTLKVENKTVRLTPGMAVTVEVKTGTRRVIEYFLSPLMQVTSESLRER